MKDNKEITAEKNSERNYLTGWVLSSLIFGSVLFTGSNKYMQHQDSKKLDKLRKEKTELLEAQKQAKSDTIEWVFNADIESGTSLKEAQKQLDDQRNISAITYTDEINQKQETIDVYETTNATDYIAWGVYACISLLVGSSLTKISFGYKNFEKFGQRVNNFFGLNKKDIDGGEPDNTEGPGNKNQIDNGPSVT